MRQVSVLAMGVVLGAFVLGCGSSGGGSDQGAASKAVSDHADAAMNDGGTPAVAAVSMEVACAHCVYHMDGVATCTPAVKVGDTPMLLTGVPLDPHSMGLCEEPKMAMVAGKVDGDHFVASSLELE